MNGTAAYTLLSPTSAQHQMRTLTFDFTARAMLCAVYAMAPCLCLYVCVSVSVASRILDLIKWLIIGTCKQRCTIAQGL